MDAPGTLLADLPTGGCCRVGIVCLSGVVVCKWLEGLAAGCKGSLLDVGSGP